MIELIKDFDTKLFLLVNSFNNNFFDYIMYQISGKLTWTPLYLLLLFLIIQKFRKGFWLVILVFILTIIISDQVSVHLFKNIFQRYRPCHNEYLKDIVHLVNGRCGGQFGFISSHACNTAAIASLSCLIFRNKSKWFLILFISYAVLNSYSRVYLGVHYPSDVILGMIVGLLIGFMSFSLFKLVAKKTNIIVE